MGKLEDTKLDYVNSHEQSEFDHKEKGFQNASKCNDACFAIFFLAHIAGLGAVFLNFAPNVSLTSDFEFIFQAAILAVAVGLVGSFFYVNVSLRVCPTFMINFALGCNVALMGIFAIASISAGLTFVGILFFVGFAFMCWYWYAIQSRIPFAVALIEIACEVLKENYGLWYAAITTILTLIGFGTLWTLSFVGYGESTKDENGQMNIEMGPLIGFVFSGFWGYEVIRYVLFATACGSTASWILQPDTPNPTGRSLMRAAVWSFGSICFGGMILAIIRTIEFIARFMANQSDSENGLAALVACIFICILSCIEELVEFLNEFGFTFVSIYGMSYCAGCKSVWQLLKDTGFESLIQFDLSRMALWMGCVLVGLVSGVATYAYTMSQASGAMLENKWAVAIGGAALAFLIVFVVTMVVKGAIITTFVIWAMEPQQFAHARPGKLNTLMDASPRDSDGYSNLDLDSHMRNSSEATGRV